MELRELFPIKDIFSIKVMLTETLSDDQTSSPTSLGDVFGKYLAVPVVDGSVGAEEYYDNGGH
jgi:hypothetical protein